MKHFAGLDVSLKDISVCVVDEAGHVVLRGSVQSEPAAVADFLATRHVAPERIVHESGQLSIWLQRGLVRLGLPAVCIDARIAQKALSARLNKLRMPPMPKIWRTSPEPVGTRQFMCAARTLTACAR